MSHKCQISHKYHKCQIPQLPVVQVYQPQDPQPLVPLSPWQPVITSVTGTEIIPLLYLCKAGSLPIKHHQELSVVTVQPCTSPVQSELQRLSTSIENQMTKLELDIQTLLTLMTQKCFI